MKNLVTWIVLLAAALPAAAQEMSFTAQVDRTTVGMGEQFTLTFVLTTSGRTGGKNLQLPDMSKFFILSGPNQSTSVQIVNGAMSSTATYSYVLQPREVGKQTIGAATIDAGGTLLRSDPVEIEVIKGSGSPAAARQQQGTQGDLGKELDENLFLRATVDRAQVMQGEQVNLTFKLYTRVSVVNYAVEKNPTMTGFWAEDIEVPKNVQLTTETVNGKQYRVGVIKRQALFPTQSGTLRISPMELQATVQVQSRSADPFDAFFRDPFGRNVNHAVRSNAVSIVVDPLPADSPPEFKGAVGQFAMSATVDKRTTRANEPVSLKITISGTGNIKLLESPVPEIPPDFEQYPPKVADMINRGQSRITGSKSFEYLLLPRYPGLKVIKPLAFVYFDPVKKEFVRLRSPQIELNVEQGPASATPLITGLPREDVQVLSQDIRFIKVSASSLARRGEALHTSAGFIALVLLPLLGLAGAFVYTRQRQVAMADAVGYRTRRAIKVAQRGLHEAEYLLKEKSGTKGEPASNQRLRFYAEISRALSKYLGDKLGISQAEMSVDVLSDALRKRAVDPGHIHAVKAALESCDMARFAPTSLELPAMQKTYDEARRIIVELERTLK
jgi:hypothetical protein